ncbi:MAG: alpha-amylase [Hungatella sp.]|nr:alpha-amylase [Hungatella sp.]
MAWYDEAVFYHIYPLGLTGAPRTNSYEEGEHRLNTLIPWISHIKDIGCNALYIGPLFESVGHGYETTDYKKLDSRLGTNEDLTSFVEECHRQGVRVILDGVFNHTGRDFFAFQDIKRNRENSPYRDWYCNVNFWGNNEYNDGFSYDNWGGYNLLAKLNQHNPAVRDYICDVIRFWAREFHIDGIRLDAADVLDFGYMQALRHTAGEIGPDFWLMGEVIHGDYTRWVNEGTLHSVTNYHLHKALYSGHNDHNYFEIAHTVKRLYGMGGNRPDGLKLYNFVDNHDVERIYTKLNNKAHFEPVHILMYTLPGVPSIYYGSEFGIEGKKERYSDDSLRPALSLEDYRDALENNPCTRLVSALGKARQQVKALSYGDYKELVLTNRQYGFGRSYNGETVLIAVNNDDNDAFMSLPAGPAAAYKNVLSGERVSVTDGRLNVTVKGNSGGIWVPVSGEDMGLEEAVETKDRAGADQIAKEPQGAETARTEEESKSQAEAGQTVEKPQGAEILRTDEKSKGQAVTGQTVEKSQGAEILRTDEKSKDQAELGQAEASQKVERVQGKEVPQTAEEPKETEGLPAAEGSPEQEVRPEAKESARDKDLTMAEGLPKREGSSAKEAASSDIKQQESAKKKTYEEMTIEELQQAILDRMAMNGPVTDRMRQDVIENVYHNSLINWIKSFR